MKRRWAILLAAGWFVTACGWAFREIARMPDQLTVLTVRRAIPTTAPVLSDAEAHAVAKDAMEAAGFPNALWSTTHDNGRGHRETYVYSRHGPDPSDGGYYFYNNDGGRDRDLFVKVTRQSDGSFIITVSRGK